MAAEAAVSSAVQILGELLIQKVNFLRGVADEVEWLKDELKRMKSFLKDATEKQTDNESVRNWIFQIRDVAHDAEDAIEMFVLKVESETSWTRFRLLGKCVHVYHLNEVGEEIESIRKRLQEIENSRLRFGIKSIGEEAEESGSRIVETVEQWRRLSHWQKDEHLVGIDGDEELMLRKSILDDKKKGLSVAAIVGMGGIGKSTLAKKIYNNATVASRFKRAWVVVSNEFTAEDIYRQIMLQLQIFLSDGVQKHLESITDKLRRKAILEEELHKNLVGKRYFIVLDDVWEYAHWQSLRSAFPDEGRLLITSRNQFIKEHEGYIHKMRFLSLDKSWELLLKTAFLGKTDAKCPQGLEDIGNKILKKCGGLPLAIKVAGGLLVNQEVSRKGWENVLKQIPKTNEDDSPDVSAILELSYWNLPARLKPCFLCLGFFEEDAIIRAKRLIHVWIAQGFISTSSEEVSGELLVREETALSYLKELINRNLVQVEEMAGTSGEVKNCRIHDLLRDLAIRKAKEEIGFEIIIRETKEGSSAASRKPRHAVYRGGEAVPPSWYRNKHLRSLFINVNLEISKMSCQLLRILDVEARLIDALPEACRALIGLKCLKIRNIEYFKVPTWFNRLKKLEVLEIDQARVMLPISKMWKMDSLRHFCARYIMGPLKSDTWKNLETLKYIDPCYSQMKTMHIPNSVCKLGMRLYQDFGDALELLRKLENITQLHVQGDIDFHPVFQAISHMDHLTKIKLSGTMLGGLPDAIMFPQNITQVTLSANGLNRCGFRTLGKLPKLCGLKLSSMSGDTPWLRVFSGQFPRLQVLSLHSLSWLYEILVDQGGMPQLRLVNISNCPNIVHNFHEYGSPVINISH